MSTDLFGNRALVDTGVRSAFDWYPTPAWATRSLLHHVPEIADHSVLECASGDDAIASVLRSEFECEVLTNDIDQAHPAQTHYGATLAEFWEVAPAVSWVITNPPFNAAFDMLRYAIAHAGIGVAFLLRKTFEEPTQERGQFLHEHPPTRKICLPRHSFRGDGSDTVSCDWFIWDRWANDTHAIMIDHRAKERWSGTS